MVAAALPHVAGAQLGYPQVTLHCPSQQKGRLSVWGPLSRHRGSLASAESCGIGSSRNAHEYTHTLTVTYTNTHTHTVHAYLRPQLGQQ